MSKILVVAACILAGCCCIWVWGNPSLSFGTLGSGIWRALNNVSVVITDTADRGMVIVAAIILCWVGLSFLPKKR
jgi:F420-0:gamma-glutamyl ligase